MIVIQKYQTNLLYFCVYLYNLPTLDSSSMLVKFVPNWHIHKGGTTPRLSCIFLVIGVRPQLTGWGYSYPSALGLISKMAQWSIRRTPISSPLSGLCIMIIPPPILWSSWILTLPSLSSKKIFSLPNWFWSLFGWRLHSSPWYPHIQRVWNIQVEGSIQAPPPYNLQTLLPLRKPNKWWPIPQRCLRSLPNGV